jgi:uncharacterized coiled-coil protein SlyX
MKKKQDRQGVRQAAEIERKYNLGSEDRAMNIATDAKKTAERAKNSVDSFDAGIRRNAAKIAELEEKIAELETVIAEKEAVITEMGEAIAGNAAAIEALNTAIEELQNKISTGGEEEL